MSNKSALFSLLPSLRRDRGGASLVEMTLATPFLIGLGLGIFEFGNFLYQYQLMKIGVADAALYLSRLDNPPASETAAKQLAVTGSIDGTAAKRVSWWNIGNVTVTYKTVNNSAGTYRGGSTLYIVQVNSTATYPDLGFLQYFGLGPITFSVQHEERAISYFGP